MPPAVRPCDRRSAFRALILGFLFLCTAPLLAAYASLGPNGSAIDPKTTTVERVDDKLYIRIKQPDGTIQEIVKELEEVKPGTEFFHWTDDPGSLNWMRTGKYPPANLEQLKVPTGKLQYHGPGFYASKSPYDSAQYGDILTGFRVGQKPRGFLGRLTQKPQESFWVLKENLSFPGNSVAEKNKLAQATYPLLLKAGVSGSKIHSTWYTFFDHDVLTGFHPVDPEQMLTAAKEFPSGFGVSFEKLKTIPQNAQTLSALEGAIEKRIGETSSIPELENWMTYVSEMDSPRLEKSFSARILAQLRQLKGETKAAEAGPLLRWAMDRKNPALFEKILDSYLAAVPNPWSDADLHQALESILRNNFYTPEIEQITLDRLQKAVAGAKSTEELDSLYRASSLVRTKPELKKASYASLEKLLKAGNFANAYPSSWSAILAASEHPDPALLSILGKELANNGAKINWNDYALMDAVTRLSRNSTNAEFQDNVVTGLAAALPKSNYNEDLYRIAGEIDTPAARNLVQQGALDYLRKASSDLSYVNYGARLFSRVKNPSPDQVREILCIALENKDKPHFLAYFLSALNQHFSLENKGPEIKEVARAFLAQLQANPPTGLPSLEQVMGAKQMLYSLGFSDFQELAPYKDTVDFGLPKPANPDCGGKFKSVAGQP